MGNGARQSGLKGRTLPLIGGQIKIDALLGFLFGVIFVSAILFFAVTVVNPSPFQIDTFKTVLALAGGGVGAVIPGRFELKHLPILRAGGGMAVFAAIYFAPPGIVKPIAQLKEPTESAQPVIDQWFAAVDRGDYTDAWRQTDRATAEWFHLSFDNFKEVFTNVRMPLGAMVSRTVVNRGDMSNPPNLPPGLYRSVGYLSKFEHTPQCVQEMIMLRATEEVTWKVFTHQIFLQEMPCLDGNKPSISK